MTEETRHLIDRITIVLDAIEPRYTSAMAALSYLLATSVGNAAESIEGIEGMAESLAGLIEQTARATFERKREGGKVLNE